MGRYTVHTCCKCNTPIMAHGFKPGEGPALQPSYDIHFVARAHREAGSATSERKHEFTSEHKYFTSLCSGCTETLKGLVMMVEEFLTTPVEAVPSVVPEPARPAASSPQRITAPRRRALSSR